MLELLREQTHLDIFSAASFSITTDNHVVETNSVIENTSETGDSGMQNISCMAPSVTGASPVFGWEPESSGLSHQATIEDIDDEDNNASHTSGESQDNDGPIDDSDDDSAAPETEGSKKKGKWLKPQMKEQIQDALVELEKLLQPP
jgi:hypothetical protein